MRVQIPFGLLFVLVYGPVVYWFRISGFHPEERGSNPRRATQATPAKPN